MVKDGKAREGEVTSGELRWSCQDRPCGRLTFLCDLTVPNDACLILQFPLEAGHTGEPNGQIVRLQYTVPNYGGRRWWMICPFEQVRAAKLYMPLHGARFASRRAWRLGYRSQRIAPAGKPLDRLFRLADKLGLERSSNGPLIRPKGMWRHTFASHMAEFEDLNRRVVKAAIAQTPQLAAQLAGLT